MARSLERHSKLISWFFAGLFYTELFIIPCTARAEALPYYVPGRGASKLWPAPGSDGRQVPDIKERRQGDFTGSGPASVNQQFTSGPTQPEMQAFSSVNSSNMVDLFSGDFAYNIPLMDVGGYPVNISYRSGISMDQEASWVGLGWNINPGTVARNLRGLPDDFNGKDSIKKITSIRENKTVGVSVGGDVEIVGTPFSVGGSIGVFHNNYRGWGIENSMNASINSAIGSKGSMTTGLSLNNNSQEGLSITPSLSVALTQRDAEEKSGYSGSFSTSLPYNSRTGLKGLQLSAGVRQFKTDEQNQKRSYSVGGSISSVISFASPSYTPSITIPFTSRQFSFTGKLGFSHQKVVNPNVFISGYVSKQRI
ncbi:MAG TPA: hypothetical protein VD996_13545, partial [Chitinophagaceae bacterium]|nr:hypothetical protein [Chitinophagaceae bacterium]